MEIELKRLTENELELMMKWRMREDINRYMDTSPKLTMKSQLEWFKKIKDDDGQIRWVIWVNGIPVGSMYLTEIDMKNSRCSGPGWFIAEKSDFTFKDIMALQQNCYDFVFFVLGLNRIYGEIMAENIGVLKIIKLCGYDVEGTLKEHVLKDGTFHDMVIIGLTKRDWCTKRVHYKYEKIPIEG
jgi:RimJ/RimL family protein N-acetyltransferase